MRKLAETPRTDTDYSPCHRRKRIFFEDLFGFNRILGQLLPPRNGNLVIEVLLDPGDLEYATLLIAAGLSKVFLSVWLLFVFARGDVVTPNARRLNPAARFGDSPWPSQGFEPQDGHRFTVTV